MNRKIQILSLLFIGFSQVAYAQIQEEKLILDRQRTPEVKKIEKKKTSVTTEKNYPPEEKSEVPVNYEIQNVPPVSDFKTSTIAGEDISPKFDDDYQNNYFQIGMGNYGKLLADGNISTTLENKMEVGADVHFLQTSGLKKDYSWNSDQSTANVGAYLNSFGEQGKFNINADYGLKDYNYYGIYGMAPESVNDLQQKTNCFQVNGFYDFYSNDILNDVRVKSSFLSDRFDAKETLGELAVNLSKHQLEIPAAEGVVLNGDLGLKLETQRSDFDLLAQNSASFFNATVAPKITFFRGNSYLMLGSDFTFLNSTHNRLFLDQAEKRNKTYWFPQAELQLAVEDEFKFYGGVEGGLQLNSYAELLEQNPFLLSDQELRATETKYKIYFGLRGDVDQLFKYDVRAGFGKMNDIMFFRANPLIDKNIGAARSPYDFMNTFSAAYDNGSVSEVSGSVQYFPLQNLVLDGELSFRKFKLDNQEYMYNVPLVSAALGGKYSMLGKKLNLGAKVFFVSDRTTNSYQITEGLPVGNEMVYTENLNDKVGGYADLNLSAEYRVHKNFSIFALGNNLLNTKYQTFKGYKVLGAQILGGVKISF